MGLSEALAAERNTRPGPRCGVCRLMDNLCEEDRAELDAALADPDFKGAAIARAIKAEGLADFQAQQINRHRRGDCRRDPR